jgi:hypothetical protein
LARGAPPVDIAAVLRQSPAAEYLARPIARSYPSTKALDWTA